MKARAGIVIPCFDEAERLDLDAFVRFARSHLDLRLLFVDDGSRDATAERIGEALAEPNLGLLRLEHNQGKAEAVRRGLLELVAEGLAVVGFLDADLATPLSALDELLAAMEGGPDVQVVMGARVNLLGRSIQRHRWRHYLGRVFATAVSVALDLEVYDTQCGAKLFRRDETLRRVLAQPFLSRWIFDVEILARYLGAHPEIRRDPGRFVVEVPLTCWHDTPGSKVRARDFLLAPLELWRICRANPGLRRPPT